MFTVSSATLTRTRFLRSVSSRRMNLRRLASGRSAKREDEGKACFFSGEGGEWIPSSAAVVGREVDVEMAWPLARDVLRPLDR